MQMIIAMLDLFKFLVQLVYTAVFFGVISTFIQPRQHWALKLMAVLSLIPFVPVVIYLNDPVNVTFALVGFMMYILVFHTGSWMKKATTVLIFYPMVIAVNFLFLNLTSGWFFAVSHAPNPIYDANGAITNWGVQTQLFDAAFWLLYQVVRLLFWIGVLLFLRRYQNQIRSEKIEKRTWLIADTSLLISTVSVLTSIFFISSNNAAVYALCVVVIMAGLGGVVLVAYMSSSDQAAREVQKLQMQHAYYLELRKGEERVRSIYHDMKNHLLVLEQQGGKSEAAQTAEKLREQIADYEDYLHTGNEILDIILKEKSSQARNRRIDFSAAADLNGVHSIEPLDISTIFGNGLDNALEASEKLPEGHRVILMKAGRVQKFLSVIIENNCLEPGKPHRGRTSKEDDFLHGFGIANIKKAAEKYGGQCNTVCQNGKFVLKILIPLLSSQ